MSKINQDLLVLEDKPMLLIMNREFYYLFVEVSKKEAQRLRYFDIDIEPVIFFYSDNYRPHSNFFTVFLISGVS